MCGIFAYFYGKMPHFNEVIRISFDTLKNRGPDRNIIYQTTKYICGFKRLAIVDQTSKGDQPFIKGDIVLMCNGEIYNHKNLEKKYEIKCKSNSDCEVILWLYKKFGFTNTIKLLDGVFAILLIDGDKVFTARDRIGVRPLFYGITQDGGYVFASEIKALHLLSKKIFPVKPSTITIYNFSTHNHTDISFHKLIYPPKIEVLNDEVLQNIRHKLCLAVRKRTMSDRPIGCLLSGGLDSSIIASILSNEIKTRLRTYSIGMRGSTDLKYARKMAEYIKSKHTEIIFTPEEGFGVISRVIRDIESYDITTVRASVGMWLICEYISRMGEDIVLMSGEGSDELFCGYLENHNAPNIDALELHSLNRVEELYKYDVLRADRCIASHGLELRVPFLDRDFVDYCMNLSGKIRKPIKGIEKYVLRLAFQDRYLPKEVLWRRKDGFSDGVSGMKKSWYEYIQEFVEAEIEDKEYEEFGREFPSKEAYYYYKIYQSYYPKYKPIERYWMPNWSNQKDPSGRKLEVFAKNVDL